MSGHDLSPECDLPFAPSLLRPPALLWPAMLPTPLREVRAVLAFVAIVFARATCGRPAHPYASIACIMNACEWKMAPAVPQGTTASCNVLQVRYGRTPIWRLRSACRAGSLQSDANRQSRCRRLLCHQSRHLAAAWAWDLCRTVSVTSTEAEAANACPYTQATCFLQEALGMDCQVARQQSAQEGLTLCGVLFPENHAALAVARKVAGVR